MSGLAVFGFKMPSLLQFEKDKASEPWIRRNLHTLYGVEKAPSDTCMRAGRARWKIENETFNTLKNQGYNFEHNYGHGYKNLSSVMTMLIKI